MNLVGAADDEEKDVELRACCEKGLVAMVLSAVGVDTVSGAATAVDAAIDGGVATEDAASLEDVVDEGVEAAKVGMEVVVDVVAVAAVVVDVDVDKG